MQAVLHQSPHGQTHQPKAHHLRPARQTISREKGSVGYGRKPDHGYHPPRRLAERLEEVPEEGCGRAAFVVTRPMYLLKIEVSAESTIPHLHQEWPIQVEELVCSIVLGWVCFDREVFSRRDARRRKHRRRDSICLQLQRCFFGGRQRQYLSGWFLASGCQFEHVVGREETDEMVVQDLRSGLGVGVGDLIRHDFAHVLAGIFEDQVSTTRVIIEEGSDVEDLGANGNLFLF